MSRFGPPQVPRRVITAAREGKSVLPSDGPGIWLELDDGATTHLSAGDVVVQCGTRHAWRDKGDHTATMGFILIGGAPR